MVKNMFKLPVVLVAIIILAMFFIGSMGFIERYHFNNKATLSILIFCCGLLIILFSGYSFRKANTTVNPITPENSTQLVTTGLYALSRNPMYIGFLTWLLACAIFIGSVVNLLFFPLYIILANKLYIIPEEKALEKIFENKFKDYKKRVRRWI